MFAFRDCIFFALFFLYYFFLRETWIQSAYLQVCALLTNPICNYAISCWTYCYYSWRMWICINYNQNLEKTKRHHFFSENVWSEAHVRLFLLVYMSCFCFLETWHLKNNTKLTFLIFGIKWFDWTREKPTNSKFVWFLDAFGFTFFLGVCSVFSWKKQVMDVCMQYALPYEWNIWVRQLALHILKNWRLSSKNKCHAEKMRGRLNFFKGCITSVHILYVSARILLLIEGDTLPSRQLLSFEEGKSFIKQWSYNKMRERLNSIKGCSSSFHTYSFLTRILFLI